MMNNKTNPLPSTKELEALRDEKVLYYVNLIKEHICENPFRHHWGVTFSIDNHIADSLCDYIRAHTEYDIEYSTDPYNYVTTFTIYEEGWQNIITQEQAEGQKWMRIFIAIASMILVICGLVVYCIKIN